MNTHTIWVEVEVMTPTGDPDDLLSGAATIALDDAGIFGGIESEDEAVALGNWVQNLATGAHRIMTAWEIERQEFTHCDHRDCDPEEVCERHYGDYDEARTTVGIELMELAYLPEKEDA